MKNKKGPNILKSCVIVIILFVFIAIGAGLFLNHWYNIAIYDKFGIADQPIAITVNDGDNLNSVATSLESSGIIQSGLALRIYTKTNNLSPNIKPGQYFISKGLSVPEVINMLEQGVYKQAVWITIQEGTNFEQTADKLQQEFSSAGAEVKFNESEFLNICANPDNYTFSTDIQTFLNLYKPAGKPLRGFLSPDTYSFDFDADAITVVETLITNFEHRLHNNNIDLANITKNQKEITTLYDALTLASIIQKEAGKTADMATISSIFHNRLADDYPLQSDVTVKFALGSSTPDVSIDDTKVDSPYNTYTNIGLPPTPINDPGIDAINAALNPENTDYFFFLYDSDHIPYFAVTYEQHQINVANHL